MASKSPSRWVVTIALAACLSAPGALGQDIVEGVDAFQLSEHAPSYLDFSAAPIPEGFFMATSESFSGVVELKPWWGSAGGDGPLMHRPTMASFGGDGIATAPVQIHAMELESIGWITIDTNYGPLFFTVIVALVPSTPTVGQWSLERTAGALGGTIRRDANDDGFVDSFFDVTYQIEFYESCGCSQTIMAAGTERLELAADAPWSYAAPAGIVPGAAGNNFFPGGHPGDPSAAPETLSLDGGRLHLALELQQEPPLPSVPGDANLDGAVNLSDFVILKNNFGRATGATWGMGDFNRDGRVDLGDFVLLKNNFGA